MPTINTPFLPYLREPSHSWDCHPKPFSLGRKSPLSLTLWSTQVYLFHMSKDEGWPGTSSDICFNIRGSGVCFNISHLLPLLPTHSWVYFLTRKYVKLTTQASCRNWACHTCFPQNEKNSTPCCSRPIEPQTICSLDKVKPDQKLTLPCT